MPKPQQYDFSGYVTKNNIECSDGRVIRQDAFAHDDGRTVPLTWQHGINDPSKILGHVYLENRPDGVYGYATFNESQGAQSAKSLVKHSAVNSLSIWANKLGQVGRDVLSGKIREVALVMNGANPGAVIENVNLAHSEDDYDNDDMEVIIHSGDTIVLFEDASQKQKNEDGNGGKTDDKDDLKHADNGPTVGDVLKTLTAEQQAAVGVVIEEIINGEDPNVQHSDEEGSMPETRNVFDQQPGAEASNKKYLSHADFQTIMENAKKCGSMKEAFLAHMEANPDLELRPTAELRHGGGLDAGYGIENIGYLFPDARNLTTTPTFIKRKTEWVNTVINGTRHTPFSRIKTMQADITADEARAKGYITGNRKTEEVFKLLKRTTGPTTIYKKQKLDRDDMVDITDMDVVAWLKAEMRIMLDEEIARAVLIGDGRAATSEDKIDETCIRPIAFEDSLYAIAKELANDDPDDIIDEIIRGMEDYRGSGDVTMFCSQHVLTDMLLIKDTQGYRVYKTKQDLCDALGVRNIVPVAVMSDSTKYDETHELYAILVDLADYTIGADNGGGVNLFDDFDIDYNQYKYLMETRCSGALTLPYSAVVFYTDATNGALG